MYSPFEMKVYMNVMCVCGDGLVQHNSAKSFMNSTILDSSKFAAFFLNVIIYQTIECWMIIYLHDDLRIMYPVKWWPLNPGAFKSLVLK